MMEPTTRCHLHIEIPLRAPRVRAALRALINVLPGLCVCVRVCALREEEGEREEEEMGGREKGKTFFVVNRWSDV